MPRETKSQKLTSDARKSIKRGSKPWTEALHLELFAADPDRKALRAIARKVISLAKDGDDKALREIAERLDGKVATTVNTDKPIEVKVNR